MTRFDKLVSIFSNNYPKFNIKYKNESKFMKFLGFILFFNKQFLNSFITTIGNTVYFPNRESTEGIGALSTLSHEYVHIKQANKFSVILFSFLYLFPQILAPFMLLFCLLNIWVGLGLFLLFLAPLPAPFRTYFEIGGYSMSLFVNNEILKERNILLEDRKILLYKSLDKYNTNNFKNANYYFMWPFGVEKKLTEVADKILAEELNYGIYLEVKEALKKSSME